MNNSTCRKFIYNFSRTLLTLVFSYAAYKKLPFPLDFADSIASFHLLPQWMLMFVALTMPSFEFCLACLIWISPTQRVGALGILILTTLFLSALLSASVRGLKVDCGCFGGNTFELGSPIIALFRDILFITAAAYCYFYSSSDFPRMKKSAR